MKYLPNRVRRSPASDVVDRSDSNFCKRSFFSEKTLNIK